MVIGRTQNELDRLRFDAIRPHAEAVDPNWYRAELRYSKGRYIRSHVTGPLHGDAPFLVSAKEILPEEIRPSPDNGSYTVWFKNPEHRFVPKIGQVMFWYSYYKNGTPQSGNAFVTKVDESSKMMTLIIIDLVTGEEFVTQEEVAKFVKQKPSFLLYLPHTVHSAAGKYSIVDMEEFRIVRRIQREAGEDRAGHRLVMERMIKEALVAHRSKP